MRFVMAPALGALSLLLLTVDAHALPPKGGPLKPICQCQVTTTICNTAPAFVAGANKGDLVFKTNDGSTIVGKIIGAVSPMYSHVGMMMDSVNVRHNTTTLKGFTDHIVVNAGISGVGIGDVHIDTNVMASATAANTGYAYNGLHTANLAQMPDGDSPDGAFFWPRTVYLLPAINRARASAAADTLNTLNFGYSLFAFSQLGTANTEQNASTCSGSVFLALHDSEPTTSGFALRTYTEDERFQAVTKGGIDEAVATTVWVKVEQETSSFIDGDDLENAAHGITNQILNTMAFGETTNYSSPYWDWYNASIGATPPGVPNASQLGWGSSVSPDDLVHQVQAPGSTTAYSTGTSTANVVVPANVTPGKTTCGPQIVTVPCTCGGPAS